MKTFKLKMLEILGHKDDEFIQLNVPLLDGLSINREDEQNRWMFEAYIDHEYMDFFQKLYERNDELMIQVKITKESNEPATFITSIIGVNKIGDFMNVLLMGTIVDSRKNKIEELLTSLIDEGYQGKELLQKFKEIT